MEDSNLSTNGVIEWSSPVASFGDLETAEVATVGLNPSNREFVDERGCQLRGVDQRFHTLDSLNLQNWREADSRHLEALVATYKAYFRGNPYDRWFRRLDQIVEGSYASYYDTERPACHLDIVPYATRVKWNDLSSYDRSELIRVCADTLALLLRSSSVRLLILNGRSVVEHFEFVSGVKLTAQDMPEWALPRRSGNDVPGVAFSGYVERIGGVPLSTAILVLGYNHNIQSSFGVTKRVMLRIREWVSDRIVWDN